MRCLIVDDSEVFLRAARALLEPQGIVVTVASTINEALHLVDEIDPDVVLIDIDLGEESGFDLAIRLSQRVSAQVPPNFILISTHSLEDYEELIVQSPARGFLNKSALSANAIRLMMDGTT